MYQKSVHDYFLECNRQISNQHWISSYDKFCVVCLCFKTWQKRSTPVLVEHDVVNRLVFHGRKINLLHNTLAFSAS